MIGSYVEIIKLGVHYGHFGSVVNQNGLQEFIIITDDRELLILDVKDFNRIY